MSNMKITIKITRIIAYFTICCALASCKSTPNKESVLMKEPCEFEKMIMVKNTDGSIPDYSEHYYDEFLSKDGKVTITMDAEIITPEVSKLPVIKITPSPISDEMIMWAADEFTEGKQGYYPTIYMNRSEAELLKINLQGLLNDEEKLIEKYGSIQKIERVKENLTQTIESIDEYYNRENPEQTKIPATLDLRTFEFYSHGDANVIEKELNMTQAELDKRSEGQTNLYLLYDVELSNEKYIRLGVYNEYPYDVMANSGEFMFGLQKSQIHAVWSNISMNIFPTYILQSLPFSIYLPYGSIDIFYPEITKSMDESTNIAVKKMKQMGINDFYVESTMEEYGVEMLQRYFDEIEFNGMEDVEFEEYCRSVDACAKFHRITFKPYYYGVPLLEANQAFYDDDLYRSPMEYEGISIRMSEDGFAEFKWTNPTDVSNVLNDNVKIISLETAIENATQFMSLKYNLPTITGFDKNQPDYDKITANININTIKLGLAGIPAYDSTDEYLLIPVWNFYGSYSVDSEIDGCLWAFDLPREPFVSVNAIDGSIIHQDAYVIDD